MNKLSLSTANETLDILHVQYIRFNRVNLCSS